jgi:hypothetical protein
MLGTILTLGLVRTGLRLIKKVVGLVVIGFILIIGYAHFTETSAEPLLRSYGTILKKSGGYVYSIGRKGVSLAWDIIQSSEVQSGTDKIVSVGKEKLSKLL